MINHFLKNRYPLILSLSYFALVISFQHCGQGGGSSQPGSMTSNSALNRASNFTRLIGVRDSTTIAHRTAIDSEGNIYVVGYTNGRLEGRDRIGTQDAFVSKISPTGSKLWTTTLGASLEFSSGLGIAVHERSIYLTGVTTGNFNGMAKKGLHDAFVTKLDGNGVKEWTILLGAPNSYTQAWSVATDQEGYIYLTGQTNGNLEGENKRGITDAFVTKLSPVGTKIWTKLFGNTDSQIISNDISVSPSGDVVITGYSSGSLEGEPKIGQVDCFIIKMNVNGNLLWSRINGVTNKFTKGQSLTFDQNNNIYVTGWTQGNLNATGPELQGDFGFIIKYDTNGIKKWAKNLDTGVGSTASGFDLAPGFEGNIIATGVVIKGQVRGTYVASLDSSGYLNWLEEEYGASASSIVTNSEGDIFIAGETNVFLDGENLQGNTDAFITSKYSFK